MKFGWKLKIIRNSLGPNILYCGDGLSSHRENHYGLHILYVYSMVIPVIRMRLKCQCGQGLVVGFLCSSLLHTWARVDQHLLLRLCSSGERSVEWSWYTWNYAYIYSEDIQDIRVYISTYIYRQLAIIRKSPDRFLLLFRFVFIFFFFSYCFLIHFFFGSH